MNLVSYTLTAEDADSVNGTNHVTYDPATQTHSSGYVEEGDEYPALDLPTGTTLVFVDSDVPLRVTTPDRPDEGAVSEVPVDSEPVDPSAPGGQAGPVSDSPPATPGA